MTIKGMDISYWQGNVDFARVAADGIKFAILREGYAQTVDAKFRQYVEGCRKNGGQVFGTGIGPARSGISASEWHRCGIGQLTASASSRKNKIAVPAKIHRSATL